MLKAEKYEFLIQMSWIWKLSVLQLLYIYNLLKERLHLQIFSKQQKDTGFTVFTSALDNRIFTSLMQYKHLSLNL